VERELFESSLRSARTVLELMGQPADAAQQAAERFRQHNLDLFEKMYPHRKNREKVIAVARQGRLQLEAQMAQEREQLAQQPKGPQD
jgi:glutathione-regulated potassium-efflux system ancillary protein KefC